MWERQATLKLADGAAFNRAAALAAVYAYWTVLDKSECATHLPLAVNGHVGYAGLALQTLLKAFKLLWRHKKLHICLLVYVPARWTMNHECECQYTEECNGHCDTALQQSPPLSTHEVHGTIEQLCRCKLRLLSSTLIYEQSRTVPCLHFGGAMLYACACSQGRIHILHIAFMQYQQG